MVEEKTYTNHMVIVDCDGDTGRLSVCFNATDGSGDVRIGVADSDLNWNWVTFKNGEKGKWIGPMIKAMEAASNKPSE